MEVFPGKKACCSLLIDKRKLQRRFIYVCRCDERLKDKTEGYTRLVYVYTGPFQSFTTENPIGFRGGLEHPGRPK